MGIEKTARNGDKLAVSVKVGEKGQIVIPKECRDMFGIVPGDTLLILADKKKGMAIPPKNKFEKIMNAIFNTENSDE